MSTTNPDESIRRDPSSVALRLNLIWEAHRYTQNDIRLVDDKARFGATLCLAFIGAVFAGAKPTSLPELLLCLLAYLAGAAGLCCAASVIIPRFTEKKDSLLFWHCLVPSIGGDLSTCSDDKLIEESATELSRIAGICIRKYAVMRWCTACTGAAFLLTSLALFSTYPPIHVKLG